MDSYIKSDMINGTDSCKKNVTLHSSPQGIGINEVDTGSKHALFKSVQDR